MAGKTAIVTGASSGINNAGLSFPDAIANGKFDIYEMVVRPQRGLPDAVIRPQAKQLIEA